MNVFPSDSRFDETDISGSGIESLSYDHVWTGIDSYRSNLVFSQTRLGLGSSFASSALSFNHIVHVVLMRTPTKVCRIHARRVVAGVECPIIRGWRTGKAVQNQGDACSQSGFALEQHLPVSEREFSKRPFPTFGAVAGGKLLSQPSQRFAAFNPRTKASSGISVLQPTSVVFTAPFAMPYRFTAIFYSTERAILRLLSLPTLIMQGAKLKHFVLDWTRTFVSGTSRLTHRFLLHRNRRGRGRLIGFRPLYSKPSVEVQVL